MEDTHYPSADYGMATPDTMEFPEISDKDLMEMSDEEIRNTVLEGVEEGPPSNVPEDMGRAAYQPLLGVEPKEVDQSALDDHTQELIGRKNELIRIKRERQRVEDTLETEAEIEGPESSRAA